MAAMILDRPSSCFCSGVLSVVGVRQQVGDVADLGVHARAGDDQLAAAPRDGGVHVRHAGPVAERYVVAGDRVGRLADREALAGECGFLDLERGRDADPAVCGYLVAGLDEHDVADHELLGVDLDRLAAAAHAGDGLHHLGERLDALLGLCLLTQPDHGVEQGEPRQHHRGAQLPGHDQVDDCRDQQHDLHEVLVLPQERLEAGLLLAAGELVGAVALQSARGLRLAQADRHVNAQSTARPRSPRPQQPTPAGARLLLP